MSANPTAAAFGFRPCEYCGGMHERTCCPRVKWFTYDQYGAIASVEFHDNRTFVGLAVCTCYEAGRDPACAAHGHSVRQEAS